MASNKAPAAAKAKTLTLTKDRETKGAVRYAETEEPPMIGTIYLRKDELVKMGAKDGSWPETITVTLSIG